MIGRAYLSLVGVLYIALGIWCTVQPTKLSRKVGFELLGGSGESEFLVVYGGLELAIGLIFLMPLLWKEHTGIMLLSCLIIHGCLVVFRTASLFRHTDIGPFTISLFKGECLLLASSAIVFWWVGGLAARR